MRCINCGRKLPPDTARCPHCIKDIEPKTQNSTERRKVFYTLGFCGLILALIAAAVLIFMPDNSFRRSMENAENCYSIAALCEESPTEAGDSRYQLILLDAADEALSRYNNLTCGYNQTAAALRQLYMADNQVVRDHVEDVWAQVECHRFLQLLNHKRTENSLPELAPDDSMNTAAQSVADEYAAVGMDYQNNMERLVQGILPDAEAVSAFTIFSSVNAQDAVVKFEEQAEPETPTDLIWGKDISTVGIDAVYNMDKNTWSFFILAQQ